MLIILKSYKTFAILRHVWIHITILWWMYIVHCTFNASNIWIDLYNGPPSKGDQDIFHNLHLRLNIPHHTPENNFLQRFFNWEFNYTAICALSICWNNTERIKTGCHWRQFFLAPYYWAIVTLDSEPDPDSELWSSIIPNSIIVVSRGRCLK